MKTQRLLFVLFSFLVLLPGLAGSPAASAGSTGRVSVANDGTQANGASFSELGISADGRYVAFPSHANNLVPGDSNNVGDIFVYDRVNRSIERVSIDSSGVQATSASNGFDATHVSISDDGRYVAFDSNANNLVPDDTNGRTDAFVHDRLTGITERVSLTTNGAEGNNDSGGPVISANGNYVVFSSWASNLVTGDTNGVIDLFVHDRNARTTERVSVDSNGIQGNRDSRYPAISADGGFVAFVSESSNFVAGDTNGKADIFVHDRGTGTTVRVSVASDGSQATGPAVFGFAFFPSISADGRYVAFGSAATNLVPGDTNDGEDIFVHDRSTGVTERVSVASNGAQADGGTNSHTAISADGRYVAFHFFANNLVPGDTFDGADVFVHDRSTGETERVSVASNGAQADDGSLAGAISADGGVVAFASFATNLVSGDTNGVEDVFVHVRNGANQPPVADAGLDQTLECTGFTTPVVLDGSGSSDPDNDPLTYSWENSFGTVAGAIISVPFSLGSHLATLTVDDGNGGTDSDSVNVTVLDTTPPVIDTADVILEATSVDGAPLNVTPVVNDLCSTVSIQITPSLPNYPLGSTTVSVTATDTSGNSATAQIVIKVVDTTAPVLTPPADVTTEATGTLTPVNIGQATATDIFTPVTITNDAPAGGFPLGTTVVTWTATDPNGNTATATQRVTVQDTTVPAITAPADITVEATAVNTPVAIGQPTVSDLFGPVTVTNDAPAAGFPLGTTVVTWIATDANGNTATANQRIIVQDTTPPLLTVPADVTVTATGVLTQVNIGQATASDIFGPVFITNNAPAAGFAVGLTLVTWTATDTNGNSATGTQQVTVLDNGGGGGNDTTPPVLTVPPDLTVEATDLLTPVNIGQATAVDDSPPVTITNDAPAAFPLGTTTVTWTATDALGNSSTGTQRVTVVDTTPPLLIPPPEITVEATGALTQVNIGQPTVSDIFGPVTVTNDAPADGYPIGTTVVAWTATDANGNSAAATQRVAVVDTIPPLLTAPADVTAEATGILTPVNIGQATADDSSSVTISNDAPAAFPLGITIVTWTATDTSGNTVSATQTVTVVDTTPPALTVPPDITTPTTGELTPVNIGQATATDIFGPVLITNDAPVDGYPVGTTVVTWTATDTNGNSTSVPQKVTVTADNECRKDDDDDDDDDHDKNKKGKKHKKDKKDDECKKDDDDDDDDDEGPDFEFDPVRDTLWPPNHKMVLVATVSSVSDSSDPAPTVDIEVSSTDPGDGKGDGNTQPDWEIRHEGDTWKIWLRAERSGRNEERLYTIEVTVSNSSGQQSTASHTVRVPHDRR